MANETIPELSDLAKAFRPGIYRHFKGGLYEGLVVGRSSEARDKEFVVYRSIERGHVWIRPLNMFFENVDKPEYKGPRFVLVEEKKFI